jgi:Tfp pilus assembly protein PilF
MVSRSSTKRSSKRYLITLAKIFCVTYGCGFEDSNLLEPIALGDEHLKKEQFRQAIGAYRLALHKDSLDFVVWGRLAKAYSAQGNKNAADVYLKKSTSGFLRAGQDAMDSGSDSLALIHYSNLLDIDPFNSMAYVFSGDIYHRSGNLSKALNSYLAAIKIDSVNHNSWFRLGEVHRKSQNNILAVNAYKKAIKININSFRSYMALGSIYLASQKLVLAENSYQKALLIKPNLISARSALEYINDQMK